LARNLAWRLSLLRQRRTGEHERARAYRRARRGR
jgi:hypothetical protein